MVFEYTNSLYFIDNKITLFLYIFVCILSSLTLIYKTLKTEQKIYTIPVISIFNFTTLSILAVGIFILFFFGLFKASEFDNCFIHDLGPLYNNLCSTNIAVKLSHHLSYEEVRNFIYKDYDTFRNLDEMYSSNNLNFDDLSNEIKDNHYFGMFISSFIGIKNLLFNLLIIHLITFLIIKYFYKVKDFFFKTNDTNFFKTKFIYPITFAFYLNGIYSYYYPYPYSYIIDFFLFSIIFTLNFNSVKIDRHLIISTFLITAINIYYIKTYYLLVSLILFSFYIIKNYKSFFKYLIIIISLLLITFAINSSKSIIGGHIHSDLNEKYKDYDFNIINLLNNNHLVKYDTLEHGVINYKYKLHQLKNIEVYKSSMKDICNNRKSYLIPKKTKYFLDLTKKCLKAQKNISDKDDYIAIFSISENSYNKFKSYFGFKHNLIEFSNRLISVPLRLIYGNFNTDIFVFNNGYDYSDHYKNNYIRNFISSTIPGFFKYKVDRDSFVYSEFVNDYGIKVGVPDNGNMPHAEAIIPFTDLYMIFGKIGSIIFALLIIFIIITILSFSRDQHMKSFNLSFILTVFIMNFETNSLIFFSSAAKFTIALLILNLFLFIIKFVFLKIK